jgi:poly-gamma-glutamate synthase PgsB/CapB
MAAGVLLCGLVGLLIVSGVLELAVHRRRLARVPLRIHVNGTRGKSSVTRLIAAALREGGIVACCKTTGTLPRMILPDGTEYPVFRPSRANVIEQLRIVEVAVEFEAQALVVECMALAPPLQWLSQSKLVRATHTVITNARDDHLEVMGPTRRDVARALAATIPPGGKLFTSERENVDVFEAACRDRGSRLIAVTSHDVARVAADELARFRYIEHAENVALALALCADLGIDRATALRGMTAANPDPGAMTTHEVEFFGRQIKFVNGFAANDPQSTERVWRLALDRYPNVEKRIALVNCRADRPERSRQLGAAMLDWPLADHYILIGSGSAVLARSAVAAGLAATKLVYAEAQQVAGIFETVVELAGRSAVVVGMANIGGAGLEIVRYFSNRGRLEPLTAAQAHP